jgi:alanyl-tRNA synthetase
MGIEAAMESGARALFGEKYGEEVRVVSMGGAASGANKPWSVELCGGTHVRRTGEIGMLKIVAESAVSSGVRRIEALTRDGAAAFFAERDALLSGAAARLKAAPAEMPARIDALLEERKTLEREVSELRRKLATGGAGAAGPDFKEIAGIKFLGRVLDGVPAKELKPMADAFKAKLGSGVVSLAAVNDGKASLVVGVTDDLTSRISAVDLVKAGSAALGGAGGGGRPDMAQAGGPDGAAAAACLAAIEAELSQRAAG